MKNPSSSMPAPPTDATTPSPSGSFEIAFNQVAVGMAHVSPQGRWLRVNAKFAAILETTPEALIGLSVREATHPEDREADEALRRRLLHGEMGHFSREKRYLRPDGGAIWVHLTTTLIRDAVGEPDYLLTVAEDIEARRRMEQELRESRAALRETAEEAVVLARRAEAANRTKSAFLANMSHEIRTPLNGLLGMLQLLKDTELSEEQLEFADMAMRCGQRLTRLLGDILDLSRIEADRLTLYPTVFRPGDVMEAVVETFAALSRDKGVPIRCHIEPDVPEAVIGDEVRLRQILFNLAGNALKFTAQGEIRVAVSALSPRPDGRVRLLFSVSDDGIGIPENKLANLGEPFIQVNGSYTREQQGAGLGLAICKRLAQLMEGSLAIDSLEGRGTTVLLMLPLVLPETVEKPREKDPDRPGRHVGAWHVLLAEDDAVSRMAARLLLEKDGFRVTEARDGREAVELFARHAFDCVLMDIQMPVLDGLEATRRIRQRGGRRVPIIAMTAYAMAGDRERFLAKGLDGYLAKPVEAAALRAAVAQVAGGFPPETPPAGEGAGFAIKP